MEVFSAARRVAPRRVYVVASFETISLKGPATGPAGIPGMPGTVPGGRRGMAIAAAGLGLVVVGALSWDSLGLSSYVSPAGPKGPGQGRPGASAGPGTGASAQAGRGGRSGGGGGGGGGGGSGSNVVVQKAAPTVVQQVAKVVFNIERDPSTSHNLADRMALFAKYFNSIDVTDRQALFGCTDFKAIETVIRARGDQAPEALDRCLLQLRLIIH